jgi:hypothetical protein
VSILQSPLLHFKSDLTAVEIGLAGGKYFKLAAKLDVVEPLPLLQPLL